ncbi:Cell cycle control protein 50B (Transmembrane protein 30B) [Durusdinium trenchii]|uniref:Cell cycle control protein 50B (Transmembrane protein 30B) n=1 Tax=Durusdinium trenchii TaxID=1381693 RepID=A0ABP0HS70_9DINO
MGTVQIHYEIPDVLLNNKDYVSSKDKDSVYTFFSTVTCSNADTYEWAQKRRGSDSAFMARLPTDSLAPCGLVNIALFTDSYLFERDLGASWEAVTIDESRVALPADDESFNKVTQDNGTIYLQNSRASWLTPDILEHWKVWQRTPPGQTVRNLWGYVEGGLELGTYRINFTENSAIWEEWGAPEKRLIITGNPSWLGNPGAMQAVAGCMFFLGGLEFVLFFAFLVMIFGWQSVPTGAGDPVDIEPMEAEPTARVPEVRPPREPVHSVRV